MSLEVNEHIFGSPREMACVALALAIHVPLYFWKAHPASLTEMEPIAEIDFSVEEEQKPPPPPEEIKEETSFFKRIQEAVGLATPKPLPKIVVPEKPKDELAGMSDQNKIGPSSHMAESLQKQAQLVNKDRSLAGGFDVNKIETKTPGGGGLAGVGLGPGDKLGGGTLKEKSTAFKIAQGDLPFAVKRGGGDLSNADDSPRIALANKTDKRVKSVSTAFLGTGGGSGGGDGAGEGGGGGLKDKSGGRGLAGVSGGFSPIEAPGTGTGGGGGGLVGSPSGAGRGGGGGGGSRVPYEISGPLSGRKILYQVLPPLPDWARERGLFAVVRLKFYVRRNGTVNINKTLVQDTSGYPGLDTTAVQALNEWRFAPLEGSGDVGSEQFGFITFKFRAV